MKKPTNTRKAILAMTVILFSIGALLWQVANFQQKQAALQAAVAENEMPTEWRAATAKERQAAQTSIKNQLDAFKRNDYKTAIKYQSEGLRHIFPDVKSFQQMIQSGYPQFAHYKSVAFGSEQIDKKGKYFQVPVTVTGADGVQVDAMYMLVFEDNLWRISGVQGGSGPPPKPAPKADEKRA